jgi:hypothetical protein
MPIDRVKNLDLRTRNIRCIALDTGGLLEEDTCRQ